MAKFLAHRSGALVQPQQTGGSLLPRLVALALVVVLSRYPDWMALREVLGHLASTLLAAMGHLSEVRSSPDEVLIQAGSQSYRITETCSYVDLILMLTILSWRDRSPFLPNILVAGALSVLVMGLNAGRIALLAHWTAAGTSWYWAHDLPDSVLYWSVFGLTALGCLRRDFQPSP